MKITILGTGTFYVNSTRSGPSYLLEVDDKKILIDCGPGTLMRLSQIGIKVEDLDYIFISHFHADHTSDLFALLMNFRLKDFFSNEKEYKTPIVFGPKGIKNFIKKLSRVYELLAFDNYSKVEYKTYKKSIQIGKVKVKTFKVSHTAFGLMAKSYALSFEFNGKIFAFSGDSVMCQGLADASKEADLFVCDASYAKDKGSPAHLNTNEIGEIAQSSKVKKVVLTHFYPNTEQIDLVAEVKEKYLGEVVRGEDSMVINL